MPGGCAVPACALLHWPRAARTVPGRRAARRGGELRPGERGAAPVVDADGGGDGCWSHQLRYPENLSPGNLAYFLAAPTLVYQMSYPRSAKFRTRWVLR
jgi:hypothetical protein